jgi:hypothetical protein
MIGWKNEKVGVTLNQKFKPVIFNFHTLFEFY